MSVDLKLDAECQHRVVDERHSLEPDRRTVHFIRSPSTTKNVRVKVNGYIVSSNDSIFGYGFRDDDTKQDKSQMLVFSRDLLDPDPMLELTYSVTSDNCRRCHGSKKECDVRLDSKGTWKLVRDEHKLAQAIEKWELTKLGSNQWQTLIGTTLVNLIGKKGSDLDSIRSIISDDFRRMESMIRSLQKRQTTYQIVTPRETLRRIVSTQVNSDPVDPRIIKVSVIFETLDGQVSYVDQYFRGGLASDRRLIS